MRQGQLATSDRARQDHGASVRGAGRRSATSARHAVRRPVAVVVLTCCVGITSLALGPGIAGATGGSSTTAATSTTSTTSTTATSASKVAAPSTTAPTTSAESQVAALSAQIAQQQTALDQADEQYDQGMVKLTATKDSLQTTTASIASSKAQVTRDRAHLRHDAIQAYISNTAAADVAQIFSSPTSGSQVRNLYAGIATTQVAADVTRVQASEKQLTATQATLMAEQQVESAQVAQQNQTRQSAAAVSAQSEATLAQVKGKLAAQVAQQAAAEAAAAAKAAKAATTPAAAQAAVTQASQAAQVASTVGAGSTAATDATTSANQAAASAAGSSGPVTFAYGGAPTAIGLAAVHGAMAYLGIPYVFGGMSSQGVDCSGLTALAWAHAGVPMDHSAADQYNEFPHVSTTALEPGDLLFYDEPGEIGIQHVVMYVGPSLDGGPTTKGSNTIIDAAHTGTVVQFDPAYTAGFVGAARPHS